ncbi:MAG: SEL1-like repeat protein [Lewinellaceae bacterium]|nr:SEL1-like repeat protein [Lewinellaceae bacterium]
MKRFLILFCFSFLVAVTGRTQTNYNDYPDSKRKLVFADDFSDNHNNWPSDMANSSVKVGKGKYKRSYHAKGDDKQAWITTGQDFSGDFEIYVRMDAPDESDQMVGIYWGGTTKSAHGCLYFGFGTGGGGEYGYNKNGYSESVNRGTRQRDLLNSLGSNEVLIRRVGAYYYFFLNKKYLFGGIAYEVMDSEISFFASWRRNLPNLVVRDLQIYQLQLDKKVALTNFQFKDADGDTMLRTFEKAEVSCDITNKGEVYLEKIYFKVQVYPEDLDIDYKKTAVIDGLKPGETGNYKLTIRATNATMPADCKLVIKALWHDQPMGEHQVTFRTEGLIPAKTWTLPPSAASAPAADKNRLQAIDCALSTTSYNPARCRELLDAAVLQHDSFALMWRSFFRYNGLDGAYEPDKELAIEEMKATGNSVFHEAKKGNVEAIYLTSYFLQTSSWDSDKQAANNLARRTAEMGYAPAVMAMVTNLYKNEQYAEAVNYLRKAEQLGILKALALSGIFYQKGYGVSKDHAKSLQYFQSAIEKGDAEAHVLLSKYYLDAENPAYSTFQAISVLNKAASKGNAKAMLEMGRLYEYGYQGIEANDRNAFEAYLKAAQAGNAQGMLHAGAYLLYGIDGKTDMPQGVSWITKAAERDNAMAMSLLGMLYQTGQGVDQNAIKARYWLAQGEAKGSKFGNKKPKHQAEYLIDAWYNMDWSPDYWLVEDRFGNQRIETTTANPIERGLGSLFDVWLNSRKQKQQTINAMELVRRQDKKRVYAATITSKLKTDLFLKKGQLVNLQALGNITLGMLAGTRSAEGIDDSYLRSYSIVPDLPHGAFIYRIGTGNLWTMAGKKHEFTVPEDGVLEIAVNDVDWVNNEGYFDVKIEVVDP